LPAQRNLAAAVKQLTRGMLITASTRVTPRTYRLTASASLDSALIVIRGDNIVLDLTGVTVIGLDPRADPDRARGVAIRIDSGTNITIRGGRIRGYRFGVLARGTKKLTLQDIDLSYGWKPRLYSVAEHESLADWLSFHHNEQAEWLRFGAAIYLHGVAGGEITRVTAEQAMNGLMMVRSDHVVVADNAFRFNSGLGIGLYRSSDNVIMHNQIDFNVRGYSHGVYRRGQDSADLLLYEQSSRNVVAFNSATHGGDGLFLWAGQSTMDTGKGGANDNVFLGNDFSYAPTNAMEATFSRNEFIGNIAMGSDYGLWGGYSYESKVLGNCFGKNRIGVAIEHGQDNQIASNQFDGEQTAIQLWANKVEPSDWEYPKRRDTQSRTVSIDGNTFARHRVAVSAVNTRDLTITGNTIVSTDSALSLRDTSSVRISPNAMTAANTAGAGGVCKRMTAVPDDVARAAPMMTISARDIPSSVLTQRDRSAIMIDEWGPFDWRSPRLWPLDSTRAVPLRLKVAGPEGTWKVASKRGVAGVSKASGRTHDTITVTPKADSAGDWNIALEYRGAATVSPRGERRAAGQPVTFSYGRFEPPQNWTVRYFAWSDSTDPRTRAAGFDSLLRGAPVTTMSTPRLDHMWYRPTVAGVPQAKWALEARTTIMLAAGATYSLRTISDDGIRVWIDGRRVIDNWSLQESAADTAAIAPGTHEIRVEYFHVDGWSELRLDFLRARGAQ
jgi:nitrous oxidase accessory protein NosD